MNISIYQINMSRDLKRIAFRSLEDLNNPEEIDSSIYDCVFAGEAECGNLEDIFQKFNNDRPEGYKGRSLSVSDVVEIIEAKDVEPGFYFCDYVGFKKIGFDPEEAEPYKEERIKVLMVEPGKKAYEKEIGTSLDEMYATLDCECIQSFYPYEDLVVIVGYLHRIEPDDLTDSLLDG